MYKVFTVFVQRKQQTKPIYGPAWPDKIRANILKELKL